MLCLATAVLGCGGGDTDPVCVANLAPACTPLYQPTYENVYEQTLAKSCAVAGSSCHAASGAKGGLVLEGKDAAHDNLANGRVVPGDPACSLMVKRLEGSGVSVMPPGKPLSAAERCSIIEWIRSGAPE